ncbi:MAG TPA: hypothetical protein VFG86_11675 [Chloroflexota bacterium]|jgi:hypothetical protein|nr:hypothetical protein [Chloroflexota bacterium]
MIARARHAARLPIAAIAVLALLAFIAFSLVHPAVAPPASSAASTPGLQSPAQRALPTESDACAAGNAYVTGDMVGEASPAEVLKAVCKR